MRYRGRLRHANAILTQILQMELSGLAWARYARLVRMPIGPPRQTPHEFSQPVYFEDRWEI